MAEEQEDKVTNLKSGDGYYEVLDHTEDAWILQNLSFLQMYVRRKNSRVTTVGGLKSSLKWKKPHGWSTVQLVWQADGNFCLKPDEDDAAAAPDDVMDAPTPHDMDATNTHPDGEHEVEEADALVRLRREAETTPTDLLSSDPKEGPSNQCSPPVGRKPRVNLQ